MLSKLTKSQSKLLYVKFDVCLEDDQIVIKDDRSGEVLKRCNTLQTAKRFMKAKNEKIFFGRVRKIIEVV